MNLTSAPRSTVTHSYGDQYNRTACGREITETWAGEMTAGITGDRPSCVRCAAYVTAAVAGEVVPVIRSWDDSIRHAVITSTGSDSESNYDTVTGDRVTDSYSYGESPTLSGVSGGAHTYCGRYAYGVQYAAGNGPAVDCPECRTFDLTDAAAHVDMIAAQKEEERQKEERAREEERQAWEERKTERTAAGFTWVPASAAHPDSWGDFVRTVDLTADQRNRAGLCVDCAGTGVWDDGTFCPSCVTGVESHARARSMAAHPAGKGIRRAGGVGTSRTIAPVPGATRRLLPRGAAAGLPLYRRPRFTDHLTGDVVLSCDLPPVPLS